MLQSIRRGVFRHSYDVTDDGRPVATITGTRREGRAFEADGQSFQVARVRYRSFVLTGEAGEIAIARRASGRMWTINSPAGALELVRTSAWKETWELRRYGETVGTLGKHGAFKHSSTADLPDDLPLPVRLFVLCVVEVLWDRSGQAAVSG